MTTDVLSAKLDEMLADAFLAGAERPNGTTRHEAMPVARAYAARALAQQALSLPITAEPGEDWRTDLLDKATALERSGETEEPNKYLADDIEQAVASMRAAAKVRAIREGGERPYLSDVAMRIAVAMEVHAALSTSTAAKAEAICEILSALEPTP